MCCLYNYRVYAFRVYGGGDERQEKRIIYDNLNVAKVEACPPLWRGCIRSAASRVKP